MLIAVTLLVFSLTLDGFTSPFSLFTIGRQVGIDTMIGLAMMALRVPIGASLGFINGFTVVKSGVHSFIITLATMSIFFGVMIFLTKANAYNGLPPEVQAFGKMKFFKTISPLLLISIVMCLFLAVFYKMTTLGRQMLAA